MLGYDGCGGASTPSKIGAALGRQRNAVTHPLDVLESTGYIHREQDLLRARHPPSSPSRTR
jgi:DNA-binding MarR family transcriptional regulator